MKNSLDRFFYKEYEDEINANLLENNYAFPRNEVLNYIRELNDLDISEYLSWLDNNFTMTVITIEDAVQYSSINVVTNQISEKMISAGDSGYTHLQIGKILQDDGLDRTDGTYTKYGENHAKTAAYLGYLYSLNRCYYVSCIGYVINELSEYEQGKLFARLMVRTNLFKTVYYLSKSGMVNMREVFDMLSEKTYVRRRSNIKMFFQKLVSNENKCLTIADKIKF